MSLEKLSQQNDPERIKLLKAATVAYTNAKKLETIISYFLIFLATLYPISYVLIKDKSVELILFGCSFFLSILVQIITGTLKKNTSKGAIYKEEFDTNLFDIPWKSTIDKLDYSDVSKLSLQYKGKEIKNWYSCNLDSTIPHNISVAILQHSNTSWDIELRKSFIRWIKCILIIYSIILFLFLKLLDVNDLTMFFTAFSVLSFYTHFFSIISSHSSSIERREKISKYLDRIIRNKQDISIEDLRDIQDEIFYTRQESAKVPNFYFRLKHRQMNAISEDYIESINKIYRS